jgi:salicylate hydroxylase
LSPNALKALRALGLESEILEMGCQADHQVLRNWYSGRVISRQPLRALAERFGASFVQVHRVDLLGVLARALPEDCVRFATRCTSAGSEESVAHASFADGSQIEADAIIGADGIHSVVRGSLFGAEAPRFTGCICWRGLARADTVPPGLGSSDTTLWMGPHGHVVHYPVRRGELVNIVAHFDSDEWTAESWTAEGDRAELMQTYARWNPSLLQLFECGERYYKWALYDRDPLERWSVGRVTLLGDAAHAMLPYLGQGACMALEDACILAAAIAATPDDVAGALRRYEAARIPRTLRAQQGSRARARENHLSSPWAQWRRDIQLALRERFARDNTPFQAGWLYDYDPGVTAMGELQAGEGR